MILGIASALFGSGKTSDNDRDVHKGGERKTPQ